MREQGLPASVYVFDADRREFTATLPGRPSIQVRIRESVEETDDQVGRWDWAVTRGVREPDDLGSGAARSAQEAAGAAAQSIVDWFMKAARPAEVLEYVYAVAAGDRARQVETAAILGVSQSTISGWMAGAHDMSPAVRVHVMRMVGIIRTPGPGARWAVYAA